MDLTSLNPLKVMRENWMVLISSLASLTRFLGKVSIQQMTALNTGNSEGTQRESLWRYIVVSLQEDLGILELLTRLESVSRQSHRPVLVSPPCHRPLRKMLRPGRSKHLFHVAKMKGTVRILKEIPLAHPCLYYYLLSPQYTVLHILFHCTFYPYFFFLFLFYSYLYLYIYSLVMFHFHFNFFALSIERTGPDLHFTTDYILYNWVCDE